MTHVEKLKVWEGKAVQEGLVDVKFVAGPNCKASPEEVAEEALHLLTATGEETKFTGF